MGFGIAMDQQSNAASEQASKDVQYALLDDEQTAVLRVSGRGNFLNSVPVKRFADRLASRGRPERFVVDLGECETLDSTFMGVLASISLGQSRQGRRPLAVCNANEHIQKLLNTLGLARLMEVNPGNPSSAAILRARIEMEPCEAPPVSHTDQIGHTLEAHRTLVRVDGDNVVRFQSVIHYLEKSLEEEKEKK